MTQLINTFSAVQKYFVKFGKTFGANFSHTRGLFEGATTPRLTLKEQTFLMRRLAFLIRANIPILEGLNMLEEQSVSRRHVRVMKSIIRDVSNGQALSKSLGKYPNIFGVFSINIIKVGESSGTLSTNLEYLADELKKRSELKSKVMGALIYPVVITVATLGITGFLMLYLFTKIIPVFSSLHMELPMSTLIVIAISTFLQKWGVILLIVLSAFGIATIVLVKKFPSVHYAFDGMLLKLPLAGNMARAYNLAGLSRTLGLLLKSGITLSEAIPLTADTTRNLVYQRSLRALAETVKRGEQLSVYFKKNQALFPPVMNQMVAVGERSGNLSNTLVYLSDLYEGEVDEFTKNLSSLIEPALMVVMGVLVGFIAVSIITPIYGITQNIHP